MTIDPNTVPAGEAGLTADEFDLLRLLIENESGIALNDNKRYLLESRLRPVLAEHRCKTFGQLYTMAKNNSHPLVKQQIVDAITTNETFWFRDKGPFVVLEEVFMPVAVELLRKGRMKVRIWSAACSTGQETYSIAMVIHNYLRKLGDSAIQPGRFEIVATDISGEALSIAQLGAYDRFNMQRGLDPENLQVYFKQNRNFWIVDPALKQIVDFKSFNLQDSFSSLGCFDVVFCRNVAIYFSQDTKVALFDKIWNLLSVDGILFLGSTESMSFLRNSFVTKEYKRFMFYQPGT